MSLWHSYLARPFVATWKAMEDLRYPIGRFEPPASITTPQIKTAIDSIGALPAKIRGAVSGLNSDQLGTPYRDGGWSVSQTVHHVADSHMNSYIRFRLALTEEQPTIKPYDEKAWAELVDARTADVNVSLKLIEALHERWVMLLRSMSPADFKRPFLHPEHGVRLLDWNTLLYEWHGKHHMAHITGLRERMGWK
jgi:hypothetical protein